MEDNSLESTKEQPAKLTRAQSFFKDVRDILLVVAVFMLVYVLFFRAVVVVGDSMYDTLVDGDRLLVLNNFLYRDPKPGDIIVASKDSFRDGECIIKRVIATEGQVVDIDFKTGTVTVDGVILDEPYLYTPTKLPEGVKFPLVVAEGCVFVMGDNRMHSKDSRDPDIGQIDRREILGRAILLLWPGTGSKDHPMDFSLGRIGVVK
jgi:signal peptidase I